MLCTINNVNLSFDSNNRLRETIYKVADGDFAKLTMCAALLVDANFKKYVLDNIADTDILKGQSIDKANFVNTDYVKIKQNKLSKLISDYYKSKFVSIDNSKTKKGDGMLFGFTDMEARQTAKTYVAELILEEYRKEVNKVNKRKPIEIIDAVNDNILKIFYNRVDNFVKEVLSNDEYSEEVKALARQYAEANNIINSLNKQQSEIDKLINEANEVNKVNKEFVKNKDKDNAKRSKLRYDEIIKNIKLAKQEFEKQRKEFETIDLLKYSSAQLLVNSVSNNPLVKHRIQLLNYANLVNETRANTNEWYFHVFNTKKMTSVIKEFNDIDDIEKQLESLNSTEEVGYHGESIDEFAKNWSDNLYKNYTDTINGRLKLILSVLPKLSQKYNNTSDVQSIDTNNKLGVPTYLDCGTIITQIFAFGDFTNVNTMIDSIEQKANNVKELYGLGELVNMMKKDKQFANFVFCSFAKPIVQKIIATIDNSDKLDLISMVVSNENARPVSELTYQFINKIKSTYDTEYNNLEDTSVIKNAKDILKNNINKEDFNDYINQYVETIHPIVAKYLPNIKKDVLFEFVRNIPKNELINTITSFGGNLSAIFEKCAELKKEQYNKSIKNRNLLNEEYKDYKYALQKYKEGGEKGEPPIKPTLKFAEVNIRKDFIDELSLLSATLIKYSSAKIKLNSTNADNKMASDVIKNCWVSRFFEQLNAASDEDVNAGAKSLLKYFTQGTENGEVNQYMNNPILFGLKDKNGVNVIGKEGLFIKTSIGYDINPKAKQILQYYLFDGTKNNHTKEGKVYAKLGKLDFSLTQYISFINGTFRQEEGDLKQDRNSKITTYPMRIGADAPKIFFIRAYRYNRQELTQCFYNHVINELNMFCKGLSKMSEKDVNGRLRIKTNVDGLIGRLYYNERKADELKYNKKTDFTSAIVENGKLTGNIFKFIRLFDVNGYSAGKEIETLISLYGEGATNQLLVDDGKGSFYIKPNGIITYNEQTGTFSLNLTDNVKNKLEQIVIDWQKAALLSEREKLDYVSNALKQNEIKVDSATINDWILNTINMNIIYDDLFEGDYKLYNGARDAFKRTKEVQAGGESFAGYDISENEIDIKELNWDGKPETITINSTKHLDEKGNGVKTPVVIDGKPLVAKNGWRAVTIYNTVKVSDHAPVIQEELEKYYIGLGMKPEKAKEYSMNIARGYGYSMAEKKGDATKVNDAQSYITFEEWIRRRHADGTINDYAELIEMLLDDTPVEEINVEEINRRIQVDKNFYYDKVYDGDNGVFAARQIKNAEFVLIPKLLPVGSELRKIHDWMQSKGISQLNTAETSKASKKNVFSIWDAKTGEFNENFEEDFRPEYVENYFYKYLYKQQEVPQHMVDETNKAGTQFVKKIIDNLFSEEDTNNPIKQKLQQYAREFHDAYCANIQEDFEMFLESVGWEYDKETNKLVNSSYRTTDENGNPLPKDIIEENRTTLNFDVFYARAREEAARTGQDSNFMEYFTPDELGKPKMPNYYNIVANKLESIAQAIYNRKITRQTFPGWHGAQITGVGYSKKLNFDPKTGVMEIYLPRWSKLIPKGKTPEEDAAILKQIEEEGLDIHLGYRMPTEGKQSISVLKVVGFTHDCLGSIIVVPDDWITQTGADFDVDSIYGICWEMFKKVSKDGKITLHKIPFEEENFDEESEYIKYVNKRLENKVVRTDIGEEIKTSIQEIKDRLSNKTERTELNDKFHEIDAKRNELYDKLPQKFKYIIIDENKNANTKSKKDKTVVDLKQVYNNINAKFEKVLENHDNAEEKAIIQEYIDYQQALINVMNQQDGIPSFDKEAYKSDKAEVISKLVEAAKAEHLVKVNDEAKKAGLMTFDEWRKQPFINKLNRRARNNYMLHRFIEIMNDKSSREEQYSRSNFDDIINGENGANDIIDELYGIKKASKSPYSMADQLNNMEDAMDGAELKAMSVLWDNFNSRNNVVRANLNDNSAVDVVLTVGEKAAEESALIYDEEELKKSYDEDVSDYEDIDITDNIEQEVLSSIGIDNIKNTIQTLESDNIELTDNEKEFIKKDFGGKLKVLVASEATDPVYHVEKIKQKVNAELAKPFSERKFHMMYIITKHDGIPFRELAELDIKKIFHFSITSLGGTKYEPGVMKMDDLLDRIEQFIKEGLVKPQHTTIRIDPIIPGVTKKEDIRHIIERATAMGIRQFKFSILDSYGSSTNSKQPRYVVEKMRSIGYEWEKYYDINKDGIVSFNAKQEYIDEYYSFMDDIAEEFKIAMYTCGEQPKGMILKRVRTNMGCVNVQALNKLMGTTDIAHIKGKQRAGCSCYGNKVDALCYNDECYSSCMYCYAKHKANSTLTYYDENGNLKDNNWTRTVRKINETKSRLFKKTNKKKVKLTARRLGHSNNNRNVIGKLITVYGSETTAHHLDAVKMGSVPNINQLTFPVYKLLVSLGIDYETAIAFIRQPIISKYVANDKLNNSVFFKDANFVFYNTLKELLPKTNNKKYLKIDDIINNIRRNTKIDDYVVQYFNIDKSTIDANFYRNAKFPLDKALLFERIKMSVEKINNTETQMFDFMTLMTFVNILKTTKTLSKYLNATNIDKDGAKPTIRETRRTIENINELRNNYTLSKDGVSFIDLIYPIDSRTGNVNIEESKYKPLAAIFNNVVKLSLDTNTKLFVTENEDFAEAEKYIEKRIGRKMTKEEYAEYKKYVIMGLFNKCKQLLSPITLNERGMIMINEQAINESNAKLKSATIYWEAERSRIYGYGVTNNNIFKPKDINNPTEEEINKFNKLTPAQKVLFIQRYFTDSAGIFDYIRVSSISNTDIKYKGTNRQYIYFDDHVDNIEEILYQFSNSFFNHNKYIKLAAIDLIKYAFVAEGFNFKPGYISKIISNNALYTDYTNGGMDLVNTTDREIDLLPNDIVDANDEFFDNFIRSHSEMVELVRMPELPKIETDKFGNSFYKKQNDSVILLGLIRHDGAIVIDTEVQNELNNKLRLENKENNFIRIDFPKNDKERRLVLYKVHKLDNNKYILVPYNLLDKYENFEYSYDKRNNTFNSLDYYKQVINEFELKLDNNIKINKNTVVASYKPVGAYDAENIYDNKNWLEITRHNSDAIVSGQINKLLKGIVNHIENSKDGVIKPYIQLNQGEVLKNLIEINKPLIQSIELNNGTTVDVSIVRVPNSIKFKNTVVDIISGQRKPETVTKEYLDIVNEIKAANINVERVNIYKVTKVNKQTKVMNSDTELILDDGSNLFRENSNDRTVDNISLRIIDEVKYIRDRYETDAAKRFMNEMDRYYINTENKTSITENEYNIFKAADRYYQTASNIITNKINKFSLGVEEYSIDDEELYERLKDYPEHFNELAHLILDAITFGNRINEIFNLDITAEDAETAKHIENIIKYINSIRRNAKVKKALENLIDIYFKKYSTNPDIIQDIVKLREAYGDLDAIDTWFASPSDLQNNETQVILKQVYSIIDKAEMFEVERNIKEWRDGLAAINDMDGSLNIEHVIDMNNFAIRQDYHPNYIEDKQKIYDEYNDARIKRFLSPQHYTEYIKAALKKDKFIFEHQHQYIVDDYYERNIKMREKVIANAGDLYFEYMRLTNLLYNSPTNEPLTEEAKERILKQLVQLRSNTDVIGSEKPVEELAKVAALNKFIEEKQKLEEEYFDKQAYEGFAEDYKKNKDFVDSYNATHTKETLEEKLQNPDYKDAYNWIKTNGKIKYGKAEKDKLNESFKILTGHSGSISSKIKTSIKNIPGAIDKAGIINPTVLTDEQIKLIKEIEENELSILYDGGLGEAILIKMTPKNIPLLRTDIKLPEFNGLNYEDNALKFKIIGQINEILGKCLNRNTGEIELDLLFDDNVVTDEERNKLIQYYTGLNNNMNDQIKKLDKINNSIYEYKTNDFAFNNVMLYYNTKLKNSKHGKQLLNIFTSIDDKGKLIPNSFIFGYRIPKNNFIDNRRTAALEYINDNTEFVTTEYYERAKNEALYKGQEEFDRWFERNHIYDAYTHRYKPLKIWTTLEAKPGSQLHKSIQYVPTFENVEKHVKSDKINTNFKEYSANYRKGDSKYDSNIQLTPKEQALKDLINKVTTKYAYTHASKRFFAQGYLPRERATEINWSYLGKQGLALLGVSSSSGADSDAFYSSTTYSDDYEAKMDNVGLLKSKGTQKYLPIPIRQQGQSIEDYEKIVAEVRKKNKEITEKNKAIDKALLNRDWKGIIERFIHNATTYQARQEAAPYLYLLLEDLKMNKARLTKGLLNKRVITDRNGKPIETSLDNTYSVIHNLAKRIIFNQFHETGIKRKTANTLQNMASAKFMMLNLYGGVANITVGATNIAMEQTAEEYFSTNELFKAQGEYFSSMFDYIGNMYSEESNTLTGALLKKFDVINFDQFTEFSSGNDLHENIRRVRSWMYGFQTMGEHVMQNTVLLAMLKSNRLYKDKRTGEYRIGDFKDYTTMIEQDAMREVLKNRPNLLKMYEDFVKSRKFDTESKFAIITGRKDINAMFLRGIRSINKTEFEKILNEFNDQKKELKAKAKVEFDKNIDIESLFKLEKGKAVLDNEKINNYLNDNFNIDNLEKLIAELRNKVIQVNHKIHGVYDKINAAQVEKKWFGSMVMQFHKHLYNGIFKHYRRRGYYSEFRGSKERGAYQTLADFMTVEFQDFAKRRKELAGEEGSQVFAAMQVIFESVYATVANFNTNKKLLSDWEIANMKRINGELGGMLAAMLVVIALYGTNDDDEIKDSIWKSSCLYLADRMYTDVSMYTPLGLTSEYKTMWRNPVAAGDGPGDFLKASQFLMQSLIDPDYEPIYKSGVYRGRNKLEVLWRRQTPIIRPIDRIKLITKNNKYYKVGETQMGINIAKNFGETLYED